MNISAFIGKILARLRYGSRMDPERDWGIVLTLGIIAFAAILIWNAWAFDTVAQGGVIGGSATSTAPIFSQSSLDSIHAIFAERAAEDQKYKDGTYQFADPSQ